MSTIFEIVAFIIILIPTVTTTVHSNDIYAWSKVDEDGDGSADFTVMDLNNSATDLGQEIDFKFTYKMYDELALILRGGYFLPGDAAGYLINGNTNALDTAYEFKGMVLYKF